MDKKVHQKKYKSPKNITAVKNVKPQKKEKEKISLFDKYVKNYDLYIFLFLLVLLLILIFKDFLFFENLYLYKDIGSDTINYGYPKLYHLSEYIRSEGIPKWSFKQGMGQNMFPFSIGDPFDIILLLIGSKYLAYGIVYVEIIKIFLAGLFFYLYLKTLPLSKYALITGGLLFTFSGFVILGSGWYVFSTEAVYAALLLLAFEKLYQKNIWWLFPVPVALISSFQPFNLYVYGLFLLIYIIFRFTDDNGWQTKKLSLLLLKVALPGLLGVLISSVFLFSNTLQIIESPRGSGEVSYYDTLSSFSLFSIANAKIYLTEITRFFSNDLLGTGSDYKGWNNYLEAPILYSGLVNLLLFPQIFMFLDKKRKILYLALFMIWILPLIFPYLRFAFWLFTGNYYRAFSFFVTLTLLFFSINALSHIDKFNKVNIIVLLITLLVLISLLYYPYLPGRENPINRDLRNNIRTLLIMYSIFIFLLKYRRLKFIIQIVLLLAICIELGCFAHITVNKRSSISSKEFSQKTGYNDHTIEAMEYLNSVDKGFFRVNKDYSSGPAIHASMNDAKVQDYFGTPSYHQFNQKYYISFQHETGIIPKDNEHATRWAPGLSSRPLLQTFGSIKYNLSKNEKPYFINMGYDSIASFNDVKILKNRYFLPLGFTYDTYINIDDFRGLSIKQMEIVLYKAFVINDIKDTDTVDLKQYALVDTSVNYTWKEHETDIINRRSDTLEILSFTNNKIEGEINLERKKLLFFSIPFDKGWKAYVNGKPEDLLNVNIGFSGLLLEKGKHTVLLEYYPPYLTTGLLVTIISLVLYIILIYITKGKQIAFLRKA